MAEYYIYHLPASCWSQQANWKANPLPHRHKLEFTLFYWNLQKKLPPYPMAKHSFLVHRCYVSDLPAFIVVIGMDSFLDWLHIAFLMKCWLPYDNFLEFGSKELSFQNIGKHNSFQKTSTLSFSAIQWVQIHNVLSSAKL